MPPIPAPVQALIDAHATETPNGWLALVNLSIKSGGDYGITRVTLSRCSVADHERALAAQKTRTSSGCSRS